MAATKTDLEEVSKKTAEYFQLACKNLSETIVSVFHQASQAEVFRVELFDHAEKETGLVTSCLGLSFHIEVVPTDAVQIFSHARGINREIYLLNSFYLGNDGNFYHGLQAYITSEADKEKAISNRAAHDIKMQQLEEWEVLKLERSGKLRIH